MGVIWAPLRPKSQERCRIFPGFQTVTSTRVRFGPFVLDTGRRQLLRDHDAIHLTPKAFHLLTRLVEASPVAISKDDLQELLWPSTFVDEANLSVLIAELRAALGDDARHPRYIRTVHGFGYAFASEVAPEPTPRTSAVRSDWWLISEKDQFRLETGEMIVGREPGAAIWIDNGSVSRRHARVMVEPTGVTLEDLGSKNGTWVDGARANGVMRLRDGTEVRFGSVVLFVRQMTAPASTETVGPVT
jgi:DNA-binding winged helix-turn-helix (wHTH) protein